ncbi:HNH endonuclease [Paracoccus shanxieyensis]|uniref:AP2/ERF domain-containing protein n=1 Tax=Paracoccus shanxieyensis TaxID=2675752 RepID=A0A6L6J7E2_9RHOB|nr:AP2 domain-containing protein [Paracoccus shanxieyensis]MTH66717.1 hypothetical protein [Paracoccus shanxieyensis]MTH89958.1 hypothetical protein [Paracoccus shanxieyensis]
MNDASRYPRLCACGDHGFAGLTKGGVALFDAPDLEAVYGRIWLLKEGYAKRTEYEGAEKRDVQMHREILAVSQDHKVDHANQDRTDNRRRNIRTCSHSENMMNRGAWGGVPFKGVDLHKPTGKYRARIKIEGKSIVIGSFETEHQAARAYDRAAVQHHGKFARTNNSLGLLGGFSDDR